MQKVIILLLLSSFAFFGYTIYVNSQKPEVLSTHEEKQIYWFRLLRKSGKEELYFGIPGNKEKSELKKIFNVKVGAPGKRPTPLPQLLNREYWLVIQKRESTNKESAPYFLALDVPTSNEYPFGPTPYEECNGQCNWEIPGQFGLHGVNGDLSRLSPENEGSSGCIRHTDEDITYLYELLNPEVEEIRYYIEDI